MPRRSHQRWASAFITLVGAVPRPSVSLRTVPSCWRIRRIFRRHNSARTTPDSPKLLSVSPMFLDWNGSAITHQRGAIPCAVSRSRNRDSVLSSADMRAPTGSSLSFSGSGHTSVVGIGSVILPHATPVRRATSSESRQGASVDSAVALRGLLPGAPLCRPLDRRLSLIVRRGHLAFRLHPAAVYRHGCGEFGHDLSG